MNALIYLARKWGKGPVLISTISNDEHIPLKFLEGILLELKKIGVLASKKGKSGGYSLAKAPSDVHMADVLIHFDQTLSLTPCSNYLATQACPECKEKISCGIRETFQQVHRASLAIYKSCSLQDLIQKEEASDPDNVF